MLGFFRRYEKIMFWVFIIPALLGFGMVAPVATMLDSRSDPVLREIWGEQVKDRDMKAVQWELSNFYRFGLRPRGSDVTEKESWEFLALRRTADEAGIKVAPDLLLKVVEARYQPFKAFLDMREDPNLANLPPQFLEYELQRRQQAVVLPSLQHTDYVNLLQLTGVNKQSFEKTAGDFAKIELLKGMARNTFSVSSSELLKVFKEQDALRSIEYLQLDARDFSQTLDSVSEDSIATYFAEHSDDYIIPEEKALRAFMFDVARVRSQVPEPSAEDIEEFYEANKHIYYPQSDSTFFPLDEVRRLDISKKLRGQRAQPFFEGRLAEIKGAADSLAFDALLEAFPAANPVLSDTLAADRLGDFGPFLLYPSVPVALDTLEVGALAQAEQLSNDKVIGICFAEISERFEERLPPIEEVSFAIRAELLGVELSDLERTYENTKEDYTKPTLYKLEYAYGDFEDFAANKVPPPSEDELVKTFEDNPASFATPGDTTTPSLDDPAVLERVKQAARLAFAKERVQERLKKIEESLEDPEGPTLEVAAADGNVDYYKTDFVENSELFEDARMGSARYLTLLLGQEAGSVSGAYLNDRETGWAFTQLVEKKAGGVPAFEEVRNELLTDALVAKGLTELQEKAPELLQELRRTGTLAETPHTRGSTEFFNRRATIVEGIGELPAFVRRSFELAPAQTWSGPVVDTDNQLAWLIRVASTQDAPLAEFADREVELRQSEQARFQRAQLKTWELKQVTRWLGVTPEVVSELASLRSGSAPVQLLELRALSVKADVPRALIEVLRERLLADPSDENWDAVALKYSDDLSDLNSARKAGVVDGDWRAEWGEAFTEAVFALETGTLSEPIESPSAYHIVEVTGVGEDLSGSKFTVEHILYGYNPDDEEDWGEAASEEERRAVAKAQADSAIVRLRAGEAEFVELVRAESDDPGAETNDGEYSWNFPGTGFMPEFVATAESLDVGQISSPIEISSPSYKGFHVIRLKEVEYLPKIRQIMVLKGARVDETDPEVSARMLVNMQLDADSVQLRLDAGETLEEIGNDLVSSKPHRYESNETFRGQVERGGLREVLFASTAQITQVAQQFAYTDDAPSDAQSFLRWFRARIGSYEQRSMSRLEKRVWALPSGEISKVTKVQGGNELMFAVDSSLVDEERNFRTVYRIVLKGADSADRASKLRAEFVANIKYREVNEAQRKALYFMEMAKKHSRAASRSVYGCLGSFSKAGTFAHYGAEAEARLPQAKLFQPFRVRQNDKVHFLELLDTRTQEKAELELAIYQDLENCLSIRKPEHQLMTLP